MKGPRTLLFSKIKYLYPAVLTFDLITQPANSGHSKYAGSPQNECPVSCLCKTHKGGRLPKVPQS